MKIGIDFRHSGLSLRGRDEDMLRAILGRAFRTAGDDQFFVYLEEAEKSSFARRPRTVTLVPLVAENYHARLAQHALNKNLDALVRCWPSDQLLAYPAARQVVLILDMAYHFEIKRFDDEYLRSRRFEVWVALKEAGAIAVPSEFIRWTLANHPARQRRDVFLLPPACPDVVAEDPADWTARERQAIPTLPFFLCPIDSISCGNQDRILRAFRRFLTEAHYLCELVLTGHLDQIPKVWRDAIGLPVRHLGKVRPGLMNLLYRKARAVLALPEYADHGLVLLEAFRAGTPVVCSGIDALRETGRNAGLFCQPQDVAEMARLMKRVVSNEEVRGRLIEAGRRYGEQYHLDHGAEALLAACRRVAAAAGPPPQSIPASPLVVPAARKYRPGPVRRFLKRVYLSSRWAMLHGTSGFGPPVRRGLRKVRVLPLLRSLKRLPSGIYQRAVERVRASLTPRLGVLNQYPPRPLVLPARYARARPPEDPPTISIVTPSFNQAAFLPQTIQSVLGQNYPRLEYIVQDGGSRDGTPAVLKKFRNALKHCESAPDRGQSHAINLGFRHATGDVLAYLNSDDLLLPGCLASVARFFARHPAVDVVYGHRVVIDENGDEVGRWVMPSHGDDAMIWADYIPQETLFWRRRIWEKVGSAIDESFQFAMDWDLIMRFLKAGARFARLPRFLGAFRFHASQKTTSRMEDLGRPEIERILTRFHGREVSQREVIDRIQPFLRRHVWYCKLRKVLPFLG